MAIVTGTATIGGVLTEITISIPTVKISELPAVDLPFDAADKFPLYDSSQNKTCWVGSADLLPYLTGGGGTPIVPIVNGSIVEIVISSGMAGGHQANVPALAGFTFELERRGQGTLLADEYTILTSGGFQLNEALDTLQEGEVFFAKVFEFMAPVDEVTDLYSLLTGMAVIGNSITLTDIHFNKLIHIAAGSSSIEIILPDLADAPANTIMVFETSISNTKKAKISGNSGQLIYYNNTSNASLYIGLSEFLWLYKGTDGWYVISAAQGFNAVGEMFWSYSVRLNTVALTGGLLNRADEPRLWAYVQTLGSSLVDEATWSTATAIAGAEAGTLATYYPYKGCFSTGDGSTTFRLPDFTDQFMRGLKTGDTARVHNYPGGIQKDELRKHKHYVGEIAVNSSTGANVYYRGGGTLGSINTDLVGGYETRPMNIGLIALIRT